MKLAIAALLLIVLAGCERTPQSLFADGTPVDESRWSGNWLVINYWAGWCAPCREEIPELNELHHARAEHGLVILGVNYDQLTDAPLNKDITALGIEFPVLVEDPQLRYGYDRAEILPMTVIINPQGGVHEVLVGPQTQASVLAAAQ
jgi:thiol-disulfide isomerase/thioredoxin